MCVWQISIIPPSDRPTLQTNLRVCLVLVYYYGHITTFVGHPKHITHAQTNRSWSWPMLWTEVDRRRPPNKSFRPRLSVYLARDARFTSSHILDAFKWSMLRHSRLHKWDELSNQANSRDHWRCAHICCVVMVEWAERPTRSTMGTMVRQGMDYIWYSMLMAPSAWFNIRRKFDVLCAFCI